MRSIPIHPWLFAAYPVLFLYAGNRALVDFNLLLLPLMLSLGAALAVWLCFTLILRSPIRAGVLTSLWLILFFSYGHFHGWIDLKLLDAEARSLAAISSRKQLDWFLGSVWVFGFLISPLLCERMKGARIQILSQMMAWASVVVIAFPMFSIAYNWLAPPGSGISSVTRTFESIETTGIATEYPDLYIIILDGYARQDVLTEYFNFSNQDFINELESLGFQISTNSRANYDYSYLSIPSFLNFNFIHDLIDLPSPATSDTEPLLRLFRSNDLAARLAMRGLMHVHLQSTYSFTMRNPHADTELTCSSHFGSEFYRVIIGTTFLRIWLSGVVGNLAGCHLQQLENLRSIPANEHPKLAIAHFIPPHHPYLFDREGNIRTDVSISDQFDYQAMLWSKRDEYLDQLIFINNEILNTAQEILERSVRPSVIVLISDHGPQLIEADGTREPDYRHGRFANLVAVRGTDAELQLPEDVSLVNLLRYILNRYYDGDLEILENKYFETPFSRPYDQTEVFFNERQ